MLNPGRPYLEITTAVLPSSLTRVLSYTLGFSPRLPVLVYGTVTYSLILEVFLDNLSVKVESTKVSSSVNRLTLSDPDLPGSRETANNVHTINTL